MAEKGLIIDFWDVGQGDGSVIRLPDASTIIVDTGPKGSPIIDWLSDHPQKISAVIITHNDSDHAGSLPSLVKLPGLTIRRVYMLVDREKNSEKFQTIWRSVREEERKGKYEVLAATRNVVVWDDGATSLEIVYPSFSENVDSRTPNETSAIVCLIHLNKVKIVWPGDAPMRTIAEKCASTSPFLLHGPHHGAPVDRKEREFRSSVQMLSPERLFVSVGTSNQHSHPDEDYLKQQRSQNCRIVCSELTKLCDNEHVRQEKPVLNGAALLGLRAARKGIPCRGCLRVTLESGQLLPDVWDPMHLSRVQGLRRPKCVSI